MSASATATGISSTRRLSKVAARDLGATDGAHGASDIFSCFSEQFGDLREVLCIWEEQAQVSAQMVGLKPGAVRRAYVLAFREAAEKVAREWLLSMGVSASAIEEAAPCFGRSPEEAGAELGRRGAREVYEDALRSGYLSDVMDYADFEIMAYSHLEDAVELPKEHLARYLEAYEAAALAELAAIINQRSSATP